MIMKTILTTLTISLLFLCAVSVAWAGSSIFNLTLTNKSNSALAITKGNWYQISDESGSCALDKGSASFSSCSMKITSTDEGGTDTLTQAQIILTGSKTSQFTILMHQHSCMNVHHKYRWDAKDLSSNLDLTTNTHPYGACGESAATATFSITIN